ncbi:uncharacterized protein LOC134532930 isoform X2 [Bacillus rossius redtenbacheri]|uniref:uncharacterized protein LOC134532930 isoform X2 n=1 Tax=Bacillus rossius redtenbacheri TaxID=93214 RepID=UPI002FDC8041
MDFSYSSFDIIFVSLGCNLKISNAALWRMENLSFNDCIKQSKPKYRYPYYDEHGRGKLLYGYGGPQLYKYTAYSPLEGVH